MAQRSVVERRWTAQEDELLLRAVASFGEQDNWKTVAQAVPGRTNKACRKRWLHSLSPSVKKSAWTQSEDNLLVQLYTTHGPKWSLIARQIHGRTDDACSKRYREALDPKLKKDEWTPQEDAKLMEVYARIGGRWGKVGQELQRSGLGCRNRHRLLERNRTKSLRVPLATALSMESPYMHEELPEVEVVYCPPEAYPSALGSEPSQGDTSFREPTPPPMHMSPMVPPFQFSSSSLSAALSDPPRASVPLPPIPDDPIPDDEPPDTTQSESDSAPVASTSTSLSPAQESAPLKDFVSPAELFIRAPPCPPKLVPKPFTVVPRRLPESESNSCRKSQHTSSTESLLLSTDGQTSGPFLDNPPMAAFDDSPSTSCSPFAPPGSLSPGDSPDPYPAADLPPIDYLPAESLLLSTAPSPYYRVAPSKRQKKGKSTRPIVQTRLSCTLPLSSDPNLRAYACGRDSCWPPGAPIGLFCFGTSKELLDHSRAVHGEGKVPDDVRPYRCALASCGKAWKNLNGLQYHLQISTAHFQNAVSSTFESIVDAAAAEDTSKPSQDDDMADKESRGYICPHPQCFKAYRQPSGLRYHLKHGHPPIAQLEIVPPSLAREIPKKARKMRRKDLVDDG